MSSALSLSDPNITSDCSSKEDVLVLTRRIISQMWTREPGEDREKTLVEAIKSIMQMHQTLCLVNGNIAEDAGRYTTPEDLTAVSRRMKRISRALKHVANNAQLVRYIAANADSEIPNRTYKIFDKYDMKHPARGFDPSTVSDALSSFTLDGNRLSKKDLTTYLKLTKSNIPVMNPGAFFQTHNNLTIPSSNVYNVLHTLSRIQWRSIQHDKTMSLEDQISSLATQMIASYKNLNTGSQGLKDIAEPDDTPLLMQQSAQGMRLLASRLELLASFWRTGLETLPTNPDNLTKKTWMRTLWDEPPKASEPEASASTPVRKMQRRGNTGETETKPARTRQAKVNGAKVGESSAAAGESADGEDSDGLSSVYVKSEGSSDDEDFIMDDNSQESDVEEAGSPMSLDEEDPDLTIAMTKRVGGFQKDVRKKN